MAELTTGILAIAVVAGIRGTWSPCGLSMVSAINPLSERARGNRFWVTATWFLGGSLVGGSLLGIGCALAAMLVGALPVPTSALVLTGCAACLVTLAADCRLAGFALPIHPRQLNELWLSRYRRWLYASGFGVQIGSGFSTYIMTAANYLLVILAALSGRPRLAFGAALLFAALRGSAVLLSSRCRTPEALRVLHRRLAALELPSARLVIGAQLIVLGMLAWASAHRAGPLLAAAAVLAPLAVLLLTEPQRARRRSSRSIPLAEL